MNLIKEPRTQHLKNCNHNIIPVNKYSHTQVPMIHLLVAICAQRGPIGVENELPGL